MNVLLATAFVVLPILILGLDRWIKWRSLQRNKRNLCAKCAKPLEAFQSKLVPVAGGEFRTQAFACLSCARRDIHIRRATWIVIGLCFLAAVSSLWL
jgi:hypothetical protein